APQRLVLRAQARQLRFDVFVDHDRLLPRSKLRQEVLGGALATSLARAGAAASRLAVLTPQLAPPEATPQRRVADPTENVPGAGGLKTPVHRPRPSPGLFGNA